MGTETHAVYSLPSDTHTARPNQLSAIIGDISINRTHMILLCTAIYGSIGTILGYRFFAMIDSGLTTIITAFVVSTCPVMIAYLAYLGKKNEADIANRQDHQKYLDLKEENEILKQRDHDRGRRFRERRD